MTDLRTACNLFSPLIGGLLLLVYLWILAVRKVFSWIIKHAPDERGSNGASRYERFEDPTVVEERGEHDQPPGRVVAPHPE